MKYVCYGGYIESKNDGDRHYISARRLAELYQVDEGLCVFVDKGGVARALPDGLIPLYPDYNGDYKIYGEERKK